MASAAFKSTTKRTPLGTEEDSNSSNRTGTQRRSRSLSRFSRRQPDLDDTTTPVRRGKFVNTVRGSGFPEISLDDLAIEFFESANRGRSDDVSVVSGGGGTQRRGRSVSRVSDGKGTKGSGCNNSNGGRVVSESNSRRRRSISSVRYQMSDSESDVDHSRKPSIQGNSRRFSMGNSQMPASQKSANSARKPLGRSMSQMDLRKFHDGYSSQSSALTDDEPRDAGFNSNGIERTIRAVYSQKKMEHPTGDDTDNGLYDTMRKELRHAVEEIRMELEQAVVNKNNSNGLQAISSVRNNYVNKLEQSERRKQDLLSEILLEEQRSNELSKIVREILLDPKKSDDVEKPSRTRKRSNDRSRTSKQLIQEAEKYFEDFISNVEDTDISSFDGEKSDSSSTIGGITKSRDCVIYSGGTESFHSPAKSNSLPVEMDGVALPWLQWETSTDASPLLSSKKVETSVTSKTTPWDVAQDLNAATTYSASSRGSWSPGEVDGPRMEIGENFVIKYGLPASDQSQSHSGKNRSQIDLNEYMNLQKNEDLLFERWRQQHRISLGGLLLCSPSLL